MSCAQLLLARWLAFVVLALACYPRLTFSVETNLFERAGYTNPAAGSVSIQQLQDQLHATQFALERSRQDAEAATARNSDFLMGRLESLERSLASERSRDLELLQGFQRTMLTLAAAAALVGLLAVAAWAYFQSQSVIHLAEISAALPRSLALGSVRAIARLPLGEQPLALGPAELSGFHLRDTIEKLEKRVRELELTDHQTVDHSIETVPASNSRAAVFKPAQNSQARDASRFDVLVGKGQSLLSLNQPGEALACFEEAFALDPSRPEALLKKGLAFEQLGRLEEAIDSYDRAIAADASLTLAYLHKGGLFNRMQRFAEALECYEQALRNPAKKPR